MRGAVRAGKFKKNLHYINDFLRKKIFFLQALLGIDEKLASSYESLLAEDDRLDRHHLRRGHAEYSSYEILRPGMGK